MREWEPQHETVGRGELFFLTHPGVADIFSGYGLTMESGRKDRLVGLLKQAAVANARPQPIFAAASLQRTTLPLDRLLH